MANVTIKPLPRKYASIPARLRPGHPPVFDGDPTEEDYLLAQALIEELDPESQRWYSDTLNRISGTAGK